MDRWASLASHDFDKEERFDNLTDILEWGYQDIEGEWISDFVLSIVFINDSLWGEGLYRFETNATDNILHMLEG